MMKYDEDNSDSSQTADNFKPAFKKYKRRDKPLDLTDVIDLEKHVDSSSSSVRRVKPVVPSLTPIAGLKPVQDWGIYLFLDHPGFYIIRNPFVVGSQRYWTSRCLEDLPHPPNVTNLTVHPDLHPHTLWSSFVSDFQNRGSEAYNSSSPLRKLRWTTIGYHYHWDTKEYHEEDHTPFPQDIGTLAQFVACVLGFPKFRAEAGIVNYYHHDSSLAAHTDHSELDHDAPLISISFGQDAIFLLGGTTKVIIPTALRLHSGDICIMSGQSRLAYHAVPRILPPSPSSSHSHHPSSYSSSTSFHQDLSPLSSSCSSSTACTSTIPQCFDMTPDDWRKVESWAAGDLMDAPGGIETTASNIRDTPEDTSCPARDSPDHIGHTENHPDQSSSVFPATDLVCVSATKSVCTSASAEKFLQNSSGKSSSFSSTMDDICLQHTRSSSSPQKNVSVTTCGYGVFGISTPTHNIMSQSSDQHTDRYTSIPTQQSTVNIDPVHGCSDSPAAWYEDVVKKLNSQIISTLQKRRQDWGPFAAYLSSSRLNINIRQVLKEGHTFGDGTVGGGAGVARQQDSHDCIQEKKKARTETPQMF